MNGGDNGGVGGTDCGWPDSMEAVAGKNGCGGGVTEKDKKRKVERGDGDVAGEERWCVVELW